MYANRVRPERPKHLVHLDAACASGRRFFFLMGGHLPLHKNGTLYSPEEGGKNSC